MRPAELPDSWRRLAATLKPFAEPAASAFAVAASELEAALDAQADELLTLSNAAKESGYSERRLRELLANGTIENAGRKHAPRIRRVDLPRRARKNGSSYDAAEDAARILTARKP